MDGYVVIKTELDVKSFEAQIQKLEDDLDKLEQEYKVALKDADFPEEELVKYQEEIEKTKNKIIDLTKKQTELKEQANFEKASFSIGGVIKKVARWGLALFGIRSAYMGIRSAINLLSQDNQKLANDIQYIKWALAKTLEPIITKIVSWVYKLIQGINYLIYRITGVNLLSKAMAKNFKKASGSAKEMQKTLQGFDEASILNKTSSGGGGGISLPTEDLSKFNLISDELKRTLDSIADVLKPIWEKYLKPIGEWIMEKPSRLLEVLGGILGLKLASKIAKIIGVKGATSGAGASGLLGMLGVLGLLVADVWLIKIASEGAEEVTEQAKKLKKQVDNVSESVKTNSKSWDENKKTMYEQAKQSENSKEQLKKLADGLFNNIHNNEELAKSVQKSRTWLEIFDGTGSKNVKTIRTLNEETKKDVELLKQMAKNGELTDEQLKKLEERYLSQIKALEKQRSQVKENSSSYKAYTKQIENLQTELTEISKGKYKAKLTTEADKKPVTELEKKINEVTKSSHTIEIKASTKEANKSIKGWLSGIGSTLFATLFPKLNFATTLAKFHKMGGIVNLPGKGVPITHYGGEAGKEGIIPMDEEAQMDLIGQSIAKHIVINLTNITKLDARQIAKETRKVNADNEFATNK
jgi:septal ring factor EnvC (AmiA/AmiB activator)